jgi:O-antigen/teichoic acid export membrane protein
VTDSPAPAAAGSSLTSLLWNTVFAGISAASAGLLLLLLIAASRLLDPVEYGKFRFALELGTAFETLMDFGLHQVAIRAIARDRSLALRILRNSLGLKFVWAVGALLVLGVTATVLREQADVRTACYLIGGSLVLRSYMLTVRGILMGLERFGWDAVVVITDRLLLLVAGATALWLGGGLQGLAIAFVGSRAVALVLAAILAHRQIGPVGVSLERDLWIELQRTAIPVGLFLVVINLYSRIDVVMLGVWRTDVETGVYANAYSVYEGLTYLPGVLAAVLSPRLSKLFVTDRRKHRLLAIGGVGVSAGLALVVGAVAFAFAEPLEVALFGPAFAASAGPLRIMAAGLSLVYAIWILHAVAISMNREKLLLLTGVVGLVAKVALNAWLIPAHGPSGAAVAVIAGEAISAAVLVHGLVRRKRPIQPTAASGLAVM